MQIAESTVAGIDEAGRGALAGPVVAGACVITKELFARRGSVNWWSPNKKGRAIRIADSKHLTPEERLITFRWICENLPFGVGIVGSDIIDAKGILASNQMAMRRALAMLKSKAKVTSALIDGKDAFTFDVPHTSVIRGDQSHACIAAASIIAKVTRDLLMQRAEHVFPGYGFAVHKGYGTPLHREGLTSLGPCVLHRSLFIGTFLSQQMQLI